MLSRSKARTYGKIQYNMQQRWTRKIFGIHLLEKSMQHSIDTNGQCAEQSNHIFCNLSCFQQQNFITSLHYFLNYLILN